ncbi:hypothetical protein M9H77_35937 [Catharanthus roseus]|uniref:Uncharacterized protein n=1 Tax=Catharanthus roseus TaxID=4058 RepID=A0ACB9ZSL3_CATRO|nr:hypothetical protein M9H77_35937 [Catharanthus roseus]
MVSELEKLQLSGDLVSAYVCRSSRSALRFSIPDLWSPWIWLREVFFYYLSLSPLITLVCHLIMSVPKIKTDKFDGNSDFVIPEKYPESWKGEVLAKKLASSIPARRRLSSPLQQLAITRCCLLPVKTPTHSSRRRGRRSREEEELVL